MFNFSILALAAAASLQAQSGYPASAVLGEFKSVCIDQSSLKTILQTAEARGWQSFKAADGTPMARAVAAGQEMLSSVGVRTEMPTFWKKVEHRRLEMVISSGSVPFDGVQRTMTSCSIHDFGATAPLSNEAVRSWAGRAPTAQKSERGVVSVQWAPGLASVPSQTRIGFIPDAPAIRDRVPFTGIALISSIVEEAK